MNRKLNVYVWKCEYTDEYGTAKVDYLVSETEAITSGTPLFKVDGRDFDIDNINLCDDGDNHYICGATATFEEDNRVNYNKGKRIIIHCKYRDRPFDYQHFDITSIICDESFIPDAAGNTYEFRLANGTVQEYVVGEEYTYEEWGETVHVVFNGAFHGVIDQNELVGIRPSEEVNCGSVALVRDSWTKKLIEVGGTC